MHFLGSISPAEVAIVAIVVLCRAAIAVAVFIDARRRGMNAPFWGVLVFLFLLIGGIVYLVRRQTGRHVAARSATSA